MENMEINPSEIDESLNKSDVLKVDNQNFETRIDSIKIDDNTDITSQNIKEEQLIIKNDKADTSTQDNSKIKQKKSDLSYYVEVPDIVNSVKQCNEKVLSNIDALNLFGIFLLSLITFIFKNKLKNIVDKLLLKNSKYSLFNICLNFVLTVIIFVYSNSFGTGIPGKLSTTIKIDFLMILYITAFGIISLFIHYLNEYKNILTKPLFPGINFLIKSLIVFDIIASALFIFTESFIAFWIVFIFNLLLSWFSIKSKWINIILTHNNVFINSIIFLQFIFICILLKLPLLILLFSFVFIYILDKNKTELKQIFTRE